jgi:hypothetical protein
MRENRPTRTPGEFAEPKRSTASGCAAVAAAAAGSGETLSDDVGAGTVQRSSRESRQDRRRAAARAADRSVCGPEGLWGSWAKRRRGASRSVPSARQRQGGQRRVVRRWRSAGSGRRQRRTGAKITVERSVGARGREDCSLSAGAQSRRESRNRVACGVSGLSPGSRRRRGAPSSRRQPACRFEEATGGRGPVDPRPAAGSPGDRGRNPRQPHRPPELFDVPSRLRRAGAARSARDGRYCREPAKHAGHDHRARTYRRSPLQVRDIRQLAALVSARANCLLYADRAGLAEKRFERIEGYGAHRLKDPAQPLAAENRRVEILLREAKP